MGQYVSRHLPLEDISQGYLELVIYSLILFIRVNSFILCQKFAHHIAIIPR